MNDQASSGWPGCGCGALVAFFVGVPLFYGGGGVADVIVFPLRLALAFPALALWLLLLLITSGGDQGRER